MSITFMKFDEWLKLNPEFKGKKETCSNCSGTGNCVCPDCDAEHDCGECDGAGYYDLAHEAYQLQLDKDRQRAIDAGLISKDF